MSKKIITVFAITFIFGLHLSCNQRNAANEKMNVMSPDVDANLVFFFKKGTTDEEIFEFNRTVIGIPTPNTSGFSSLPGMMTQVKVIIDGFDGEAINFQPDAMEEQKAFVKKRVLESPLVCKVYENVVPSRINDLWRNC